MQRRSTAVILTAVFGAVFLFNDSAAAQRPRDRVTSPVDDRQTVRLPGNRHALARRQFETGPAPRDQRMERMILVLQSSDDQRAALAELIEAQHDPNSPQFQKWLTPETFAERFGVSQNDLDQVVAWLAARGFSVEETAAGNQSIVFSGTAEQVAAAFHTEIRSYNVGGALHQANAEDPAIPAALADVVAGVATLHDFRRQPMHAIQATPDYTSGTAHYLTPGDFAKIYDVAPLYSAGIDGTGQTIAIVGRTNLNPVDITNFRSAFGLAANAPTIVVNGTNPGIVSQNEQVEADLDVQWSGAVAPKAAIKFVVSGSTSASDGVDLSALYIVSHNLAPVMSTSFGSCESSMGAAERAFYNNLWQQAAAQGITTVISSGDSGAAGCDQASATAAMRGAAVNGLCSTPYSVCVGGTEFNDAATPSLYWSTANSSTRVSALSYIPEVVWNESRGTSGGSGLWASGGGASAYYAKPSWQSGPGVPADGKRDVPDVSLAAAGHDGYMVAVNGSFYVVSGTSAASPAFAGLMALVNQKTNARQGNANTTLYALGRAQASGGPGYFHDITAGNNSVPGVTGFTAGARYDLATGLGSADAFVLVNHWTDGSAPSAPSTPTLTLTTGSSAVTVQRGASGAVAATVTLTGATSAVGLTIAGVPAGVTATFAPAGIASPGSGSSVLTVTVSAGAAAGTYPLTITASGASLTKTAIVNLTIPEPATFKLTATPATLTLAQGGSAAVQVAVTSVNGFTGSITLNLGSLPQGVTAKFSAGPSGTAMLNLQTSQAAPRGTYNIVLTGSSPGVSPSPTVTISLTIR